MDVFKQLKNPLLLRTGFNSKNEGLQTVVLALNELYKTKTLKSLPKISFDHVIRDAKTIRSDNPVYFPNKYTITNREVQVLHELHLPDTQKVSRSNKWYFFWDRGVTKAHEQSQVFSSSFLVISRALKVNTSSTRRVDVELIATCIMEIGITHVKSESPWKQHTIWNPNLLDHEITSILTLTLIYIFTESA